MRNTFIDDSLLTNSFQQYSMVVSNRLVKKIPHVSNVIELNVLGATKKVDPAVKNLAIEGRENTQMTEDIPVSSARTVVASISVKQSLGFGAARVSSSHAHPTC